MAKKIEIKTRKTKTSLSAAINKIKNTEKKNDYKKLVTIFKDATKANPKLWGKSIVGFGEYNYQRSNGDFGTFLATGFSLGKSGLTIYIIPGFKNYSSILKKLGPHKSSKSCLYLKDLSEIDLKLLKNLISSSIKDLKKTHEVKI